MSESTVLLIVLWLKEERILIIAIKITESDFPAGLRQK